MASKEDKSPSTERPVLLKVLSGLQHLEKCLKMEKNAEMKTKFSQFLKRLKPMLKTKNPSPDYFLIHHVVSTVLPQFVNTKEHAIAVEDAITSLLKVQEIRNKINDDGESHLADLFLVELINAGVGMDALKETLMGCAGVDTQPCVSGTVLSDVLTHLLRQKRDKLDWLEKGLAVYAAAAGRQQLSSVVQRLVLIARPSSDVKKVKNQTVRALALVWLSQIFKFADTKAVLKLTPYILALLIPDFTREYANPNSPVLEARLRLFTCLPRLEMVPETAAICRNVYSLWKHCLADPSPNSVLVSMKLCRWISTFNDSDSISVLFRMVSYSDLIGVPFMSPILTDLVGLAMRANTDPSISQTSLKFGSARVFTLGSTALVTLEHLSSGIAQWSKTEEDETVTAATATESDSSSHVQLISTVVDAFNQDTSSQDPSPDFLRRYRFLLIPDRVSWNLVHNRENARLYAELVVKSCGGSSSSPEHLLCALKKLLIPYLAWKDPSSKDPSSHRFGVGESLLVDFSEAFSAESVLDQKDTFGIVSSILRAWKQLKTGDIEAVRYEFMTNCAHFNTHTLNLEALMEDLIQTNVFGMDIDQLILEDLSELSKEYNWSDIPVMDSKSAASGFVQTLFRQFVDGARVLLINCPHSQILEMSLDIINAQLSAAVNFDTMPDINGDLISILRQLASPLISTLVENHTRTSQRAAEILVHTLSLPVEIGTTRDELIPILDFVGELSRRSLVAKCDEVFSNIWKTNNIDYISRCVSVVCYRIQKELSIIRPPERFALSILVRIVSYGSRNDSDLLAIWGEIADLCLSDLHSDTRAKILYLELSNLIVRLIDGKVSHAVQTQLLRPFLVLQDPYLISVKLDLILDLTALDPRKVKCWKELLNMVVPAVASKDSILVSRALVLISALVNYADYWKSNEIDAVAVASAIRQRELGQNEYVKANSLLTAVRKNLVSNSDSLVQNGGSELLRELCEGALIPKYEISAMYRGELVLTLRALRPSQEQFLETVMLKLTQQLIKRSDFTFFGSLEDLLQVQHGILDAETVGKAIAMILEEFRDVQIAEAGISELVQLILVVKPPEPYAYRFCKRLQQYITHYTPISALGSSRTEAGAKKPKFRNGLVISACSAAAKMVDSDLISAAQKLQLILHLERSAEFGCELGSNLVQRTRVGLASSSKLSELETRVYTIYLESLSRCDLSELVVEDGTTTSGDTRIPTVADASISYFKHFIHAGSSLSDGSEVSDELVQKRGEEMSSLASTVVSALNLLHDVDDDDLLARKQELWELGIQLSGTYFRTVRVAVQTFLLRKMGPILGLALPGGS
eukprot:gnl/Dysnectes_brevis/5798_a8571_457.p1 GENE.gnl/Dysnectes_brevis/5798_a8571_457~~gnl/Dysnectes_brevis/5798_a8571_457.p1  ORF type:complete len:1323 (-),score=122.16 gnl/Dysnectes_brevis/5798_a8571_457:268-4236(-)